MEGSDQQGEKAAGYEVIPPAPREIPPPLAIPSQDTTGLQEAPAAADVSAAPSADKQATGPATGSDQGAEKALGYKVVPPTQREAPPLLDIPVRQAQVEQPAQTRSKKAPNLLWLVLVFFVLAAVAGVYAGFVVKRPKSAPPPFQDLGAGLSNAAGLKGYLKARWIGKASQYDLKFEALDPLQSAGFSYIAANPPSPLSVHFRLLDGTGFALCGKDVLFHFNPAGTASVQSQPQPAAKKTDAGDAAQPAQPALEKTEGDREREQDVFQNSLGDDGNVIAVTAQGALACTEDQYRQIVYWDFSTNFPTLAEQEAILNHSAESKARDAAAVLRKNARMRSGFIAQGDDTVTGYDAPRSILQTRLKRDFLVTKGKDQATASSWAASGVLFHYKCDQRSRCMLTHAGGGESISVFALQ